MRVAFLEALHHKWQQALAGKDVLPTAGRPSSQQLLSGYLRHDKAAEAAAAARPAATWKQVPAHGLAPACPSFVLRPANEAFMAFRRWHLGKPVGPCMSQLVGITRFLQAVVLSQEACLPGC